MRMVVYGLLKARKMLVQRGRQIRTYGFLMIQTRNSAQYLNGNTGRPQITNRKVLKDMQNLQTIGFPTKTLETT